MQDYHRDRKIAKLARRSRLLAERHSREQVAHWHPQVQHHILSGNAEIAQAFSKNITELYRFLCSMRETLQDLLDESTAREVCEAIPTMEQLVAKAYRSCGFHLEREFGVSLVRARSFMPADASVIDIPSDAEDVRSPQIIYDTDDDDDAVPSRAQTIYDTDDDDDDVPSRAQTIYYTDDNDNDDDEEEEEEEEEEGEEEEDQQPNQKRPHPTSSQKPPAKRRRHGSSASRNQTQVEEDVPDAISESSYHPSPSPSPSPEPDSSLPSQSQSLSQPQQPRTVVPAIPTRIIGTRSSHISSSSSSSSSSQHPTPSPTPSPGPTTSASSSRRFRIPNLRRHGWPREHTSDRRPGVIDMTRRVATRDGTLGAPVADMGE
ncbi:hypothetical protein QBC44DRAFT_388298 [Cladorrhinum sp. PSN332]|nr:hypothetical protein QBC44DRAFT_388298 [Cladorrhinum sp. PSN332]